MIIVTVQLHSAVTGKKTTIGRAIIDNDGTGTAKKSNYNVRVGRRDRTEIHQVLGKPLRKGKVKDYPRASYNVWRLVIRALRSAFPEEK